MKAKKKKDANSEGMILIVHCDFGDVNVERAIIEGVRDSRRAVQEQGRSHRARARRRRRACQGISAPCLPTRSNARVMTTAT